MSSLRQKAVSATFWSAIDSVARQGLRFGLSLVLARLLTPTDYGIVGLLDVFIAVALVFTNAGFSSALIQRAEVSDEDLSSVFYFNLALSVVVAAVLCAGSGLIARFFEQPVLRPLTWLLAANLVVSSLGAVQHVLLNRELNFRRQCLISLGSLLLSGVVAIVLAWRGYGVWSLAMQTLVAGITTTALLWLLSPWRPIWFFSMAPIRSLFKFGSYLLFSGVLDTLYTRVNTLLIGKFYSPRDLGYYSRADHTTLLPGNAISQMVSRVAFPLFAAAQHDKARLRSGLRRAVTLVMMVNIPLMFGLAVAARPVVEVLFGEQWLPCVPYVQILSLSGLFWPLHLLNLNILNAQGRSDLFFRLEVVKKILGLALVGTACFFGVIAIAWSAVAMGVLCLGLNARYSDQFLGYGAWRQCVDVAPYAGVAAAMAGCVWALSLIPFGTPFALLAAQLLVGAAVYVGACAGLKLEAFREGWAMFSSALAKRRLRPAAA